MNTPHTSTCPLHFFDCSPPPVELVLQVHHLRCCCRLLCCSRLLRLCQLVPQALQLALLVAEDGLVLRQVRLSCCQLLLGSRQLLLQVLGVVTTAGVQQGHSMLSDMFEAVQSKGGVPVH